MGPGHQGLGREGGRLGVVANSPAEAEAFIRSEIAKWAKAVKESGATAE